MEAKSPLSGNFMAKKMLIDATHPEETRVVVVDGQKVEDFDFESITKRQLAGNIYLAKVTRVEPSLQAAFVEYGGNRHGFLAFSEIHPDYYQIPIADREALLAEEAREEEERRAREDAEADGEKNAKPAKGRRSRSRKSKAQDKDAAAAASVAGLEVVEVTEADASVPNGLEIADSDTLIEDGPLVSLDPAGDNDTIESATVESEAETAPETAAPQPAEAEVEAATAEDTVAVATDADTEGAATETVAEAAADDPSAEPLSEPTAEEATEAPESSGPRSIAESAGLEDEERVTEDIGAPDSARTVSGEAAADEPVEPEPETPAQDEAPAADDGADDAQPDVAADAEDAGEATTQTAADATTEAEGQAKAEATADEKPAKKPRQRRRSRGSRKKDDAAAEASSDANGDDEDENGSGTTVESMGAEDTLEEAAQARTRLRRKYKIQDVIKMRQILLVQVVKEERGNKGAALTTYLSLAGRYCVLMPNTARGGGISRKITNASDRKRLREITGELDVPQGMGLIVRTAGAERTRAEIKRDYEFLIRQWEQIREKTLESIAPTQIYEEGSLIKRSIRDVYSKEIDQILVEGETGYREAKEYMKMLMPSHAKNVQKYEDQIPLLSRYQVESYLNGMFNPTVQLKSGGYIVIGVTEALVAIDVNSGRATKQGSIEETALQTNLEAADEVARQLRLRDLAGLIVIDFIDMDENRNNRAVEKRMKDRLKNDRARIQVGRISAFGLMEMSRQRLRPGMLEATTQPCPHCMGTGLIRSDENLSLSILREVEEEGLRNRTAEVQVRAPVDVANYLINTKRQSITQMEERHDIVINVLADPSLVSPNFVVEGSKTATKRPTRDAVPVTSDEVAPDVAAESESDNGEGDGKSRRRRGKRGGKRRRGEDGEGQAQDNAPQESQEAEAGSGEEDEKPRSRRSRGRRRGGRGRKGDQAETAQDAEVTETAEAQTDDQTSGATEAPEAAEAAETPAAPSEETVLAEAPVADLAEEAPDAEAEPVAEPEPEAAPEPEPEVVTAEAPAPEPVSVPDEPAKPKKRGWWSFGG